MRTVLALLIVGIPSIALADAVPPPPLDCPPGAIGATGHNGEWCTPTTCTDDTSCAHFEHPGPRVCRTQGLCVEEKTEPSASGWSQGSPLTRTFAHAGCAADATCEKGQCVEAKRCVLQKDVKPEPTPTPTPASETKAAESTPTPAPAKKGCAAGGVDGLAWLAGLALLLKRRRASRH